MSKSLIVFSSDAKSPENKLSEKEQYTLRMNLATAAAFKYKKFDSEGAALDWYLKNYEKMSESDECLINSAQQASDPFQFIAKLLCNERVSYTERIKGLNMIPVTKDAAASAYQIISFLLLNKEIAILTNLLPSSQNEESLKIQDLYLNLKDELLVFLSSRLEYNKYTIIESLLTRKLVKALFMPLIYGKTIRTMIHDIREVYGLLLSYQDTEQMGKLCLEFWKNKYPDIVNLMNLINLIGWFCSVLDKPVHYSIPFFTTVQDYMRSDTAEIWVYDSTTRKRRRRVTLRVPTTNRDTRKTQVSTCVNFIHQRDAYIAMKVVEKLTKKTQAPIYTVHDNFITTSIYANEIPHIYTKVYLEMGDPLIIINEFILQNLYFEGCDNPWKTLGINKAIPIPCESLREIMNSQKFDKIKDKNKLDKKIEEIVSCYDNYVNTVKGRYDDFEKELKSWESFKCNYCLHY